MRRFGSGGVGNVLVVGAAAMLIGLPAAARAQDATAKPAKSATPSSAMGAGAMHPSASATPDSARMAGMRAQFDTQLKQLDDALKLSPEQRDKVRPIFLDHTYQLGMLRQKYMDLEHTPANREAMMKDAAKLNDATDVQLAKVLTPDQMTTYKKWRSDMANRARARMAAADSAAGAKK